MPKNGEKWRKIETIKNNKEKSQITIYKRKIM